MSYYNPNAYGLDASATENMQPINVPPVTRYLVPRGSELFSGVTTLQNGVHARAKHIMYVPIVVDQTTTYDRIGINYVSANSCVSTWYYDLGLYSGNVEEEYPATKLADFGTITIDPAVTSPGAQLITINQTLDANTLYFLAVGVRWNNNTDQLANRSPYVTQQQGHYAMFSKLGLSAATASNGGYGWMEQLVSYSGTLPASTSYASVNSIISNGPRVAMRRSA